MVKTLFAKAAAFIFCVAGILWRGEALFDCLMTGRLKVTTARGGHNFVMTYADSHGAFIGFIVFDLLIVLVLSAMLLSLLFFVPPKEPAP
jgi:hypothetical protein